MPRKRNTPGPVRGHRLPGEYLDSIGITTMAEAFVAGGGRTSISVVNGRIVVHGPGSGGAPQIRRCVPETHDFIRHCDMHESMKGDTAQ